MAGQRIGAVMAGSTGTGSRVGPPVGTVCVAGFNVAGLAVFNDAGEGCRAVIMVDVDHVFPACQHAGQVFAHMQLVNHVLKCNRLARARILTRIMAGYTYLNVKGGMQFLIGMALGAIIHLDDIAGFRYRATGRYKVIPGVNAGCAGCRCGLGGDIGLAEGHCHTMGLGWLIGDLSGGIVERICKEPLGVTGIAVVDGTGRCTNVVGVVDVPDIAFRFSAVQFKGVAEGAVGIGDQRAVVAVIRRYGVL
jgi:hypothetical protein